MAEKKAPERIVNGIKTRIIGGKDYVEVSERIRIAHQVEDFEMISSAPLKIGERWVWQVSVNFSGKLFIGSAEIHLDALPPSADAKDPFACAETSALGRALGFAGMGTVDSIAGYDEISTRSQAGIEARQPVIVEAPKLGPVAIPTPQDLFEAGKLAHMWNDYDEFRANASELLSQKIEKGTKVSSEDLLLLQKIIEASSEQN